MSLRCPLLFCVSCAGLDSGGGAWLDSGGGVWLDSGGGAWSDSGGGAWSDSGGGACVAAMLLLLWLLVEVKVLMAEGQCSHGLFKRFHWPSSHRRLTSDL